MATRVSIANGNWTTATTWGVCDATSRHTDSTSQSTTTSYVGATNTTPGAIVISGIVLRIATKTSGGTFSMELWNATDSVQVAGSEVTINVADLPITGAAYLKFAGNVTLEAAHNYYPRVKSSSTGTVSPYRAAATSGEWDFFYVTTTTGAPAAGDKLIVVGSLESAGTGTDITVTMNETATTDYGTTSTTLPSLIIGKRGILTWGNTSSTAYYLKLSGVMEVAGGTVTIGNETTDSTSELVFDCASNVDFGIKLLGDHTFNTLGATGVTPMVDLSGDTVVSDSYFNVGTTSGWTVGDEIVFAPTNRTNTEYEKHTINAIDSATEGTISGLFAYVHSGTSPTNSKVINITRKTKIHGASASAQAYIVTTASATNSVIDLSYTEFYWMGSATANKKGVELSNNPSNGSIDVAHCSFHNFEVTGSTGLTLTGSGYHDANISNTVFHSINNTALSMPATSGIGNDVTAVTVIYSPNGNAVSIGDARIAVDSIYVAGGNIGIIIGENNAIFGTATNLVAHSCLNYGVYFSRSWGGTFEYVYGWRNGGTGIFFDLTVNHIVRYGAAFGNVNAGIYYYNQNWNVKIFDVLVAGDSTYAQATGLTHYTGLNYTTSTLENCTFGVATGIYVAHTSRDIYIYNDAYAEVVLRKCVLASTTEVASMTSLIMDKSFVASQNHDATAGNNRWYSKNGNGVIDTTIYNTASPSLRLTPNILSGSDPNLLSYYGDVELAGNGRFSCAVASGQTVTVSVYVRGSTIGDGSVYNGQYPKLYVERNYVGGVSTTQLAQATAASSGSWEQISGTTSAVSDDCILNFYVNCGGAGYSTGWVNVDDWSATVTDRKGNKYWFDGAPSPVGDNTSGTTSTGSAWFAGE